MNGALHNVNNQRLGADLPITHPDDDRLGYASFARHIAGGICNMCPTDGFTIGICGAWGSGKSTMLNLITHYLRQYASQKQPILVNFNPWMFSGQGDITLRFFNQLLAVVGKSLDKETRKIFNQFSQMVSTPPQDNEKSSLVSGFLQAELPDIYDLKRQIERALLKQERPVMVVFDDIDRLTGPEMIRVFQLIKAVASFPRIIYLLAFDDKIVTQALSRIEGMAVTGQEYLEKIIQLPIHLPSPNLGTVRKLLFDKINRILAGTPSMLFDRKHWDVIYNGGIDHFLDKPRNIVRFINALTITYSAVRGSVDAVDFIAIEILRIFCPKVYFAILHNSEQFATGMGQVAFADSNEQQLLDFHNRWVEQTNPEDIAAVQKIVIGIFPKIKALWEHKLALYEAAELPNELRIAACSREVFARYFSFRPPGETLTNEFDNLLELNDDSRKLKTAINYLANTVNSDGSTKGRVFLLQFVRSEDTITREKSMLMARVMIDVGDCLMSHADETKAGFLEPDNETLLILAMHKLLEPLTSGERVQVVREAVSKGNSPFLTATTLLLLGSRFEKLAQQATGTVWVDELQLFELENTALHRFREWAKSGQLAKAPRLPRIMRCFEHITNGREARRWLRSTAWSDEGLRGLLQGFITYYHGEPVFEMDVLMQYIEAQVIQERIQEIAKVHNLTDKEHCAIKQFTEKVDGYSQPLV